MSINRWIQTTARNQYGWELCGDFAPCNRHSNEGVGEAEMGVSYFYKITIFFIFYFKFTIYSSAFGQSYSAFYIPRPKETEIFHCNRFRERPINEEQGF